MMPVPTFKPLLVVAIACLASATPARAQDATPVEVTPFVALGSNGSSPFGVLITFPVTTNLSLETEVGYRRGEDRMHALSTSASLLYLLPRVGKAMPYAIGGVGLAEYGAPIVPPSGGYPIGTEPRLAWTVNAGGGLKVPMNDTLDLRTDARWSKSFGRHGSEQFRVAQGLSVDLGKR